MQQARKLDSTRKKVSGTAEAGESQVCHLHRGWSSLSKPLPPTRCPAFSSGCCAKSTAVRSSHAAAAMPKDLPASQKRHPSARTATTVACTGVYLHCIDSALHMVTRS